ncbi:TPA: ATP-binding cassette domain-containing protein [Streptococcus suis]
MLQIKNLTINHQKDFRPLVNNLSISIQTGDKVAIIGEEGNGKSSLLKLIMDSKLVQDFLHFEGEVLRDYSSYTYLPQSLSVEKAEQTLWSPLKKSST